MNCVNGVTPQKTVKWKTRQSYRGDTGTESPKYTH